MLHWELVAELVAEQEFHVRVVESMHGSWKSPWPRGVCMYANRIVSVLQIPSTEDGDLLAIGERLRSTWFI